MTDNDKLKNRKAGYILPAKLLYDGTDPANAERRARLLKADGFYDYKNGEWVCPGEQIFAQFCKELNYTPVVPVTPVSTVTQSAPAEPAVEPAPALAVTAPPPGAPPLKLVKPPAELKPDALQGPGNKRLLALPPCFIVTQQVQVQGDIHYLHGDEQLTTTQDGETTVAKTKKTIEVIVRDPEEKAEADATASQLRSEVRKLGTVLQSGVILVPTAKAAELDAAMSSCRQTAIEWNDKATSHFLRVSLLKAAITSDAEAAARDIAYTLQETMARLESALESCDVKKIKSVLDNAKPLTRVLPAKEANALSAALASAGATKKYIEEQLNKKKVEIEEVKKEVARTSLGPVQTARAMYLELAGPVEMEIRNSADGERFAALDATSAADATGTSAGQPQAAVNGDRYDM